MIFVEKDDMENMNSVSEHFHNGATKAAHLELYQKVDARFACRMLSA